MGFFDGIKRALGMGDPKPDPFQALSEGFEQRAKEQEAKLQKEAGVEVAGKLAEINAQVAALTGGNLRANGVSGRARVLSIASTGQVINMMPVCRVEVEIDATAGPYRASASQLIDQVALPRVQPGMTVAIKIDPSNPTNVFVDI